MDWKAKATAIPTTPKPVARDVTLMPKFDNINKKAVTQTKILEIFTIA
jgi:hypothetical protein